MAGNPEEEKLWLKIGIYIFGTALGVAAKLAVMHRTKAINLKDVVINSIIAFAAAWMMYAYLENKGLTQYATLASVICGRFADDIWNMGLRWLRTISQNVKEVK